MTPFIADGPMIGTGPTGPMKGAQDRLGLAPGYGKSVPSYTPGENGYTDADYQRSLRRSRMHDVGMMLRQVEEMRAASAHAGLMQVESLLNEAVLQLTVTWSEIRRDVRRDDGVED